MPMTHATTVTAKVAYTPEEWELYTTIKKCSAAAARLNKAFNRLIKQHNVCSEESANAVNEGMRVACNENSEYGAADSEPRWVVRSTIRQIYGVETG